MSFQDAKALMQSQGIKTSTEFNEWKQDGNRPKDFPSNPSQTYKNKWRGWGDFLGTGNISTRKKEKRKWMSFDQAKALMQSQSIRTFAQFQEWSKSEQRPKDFPSNPNIIYKDKWRGWGDFLGTGNISTRKREKRDWMSFQDAKALMQSQGIRTFAQFKEWKKAGNRPENFPSNPNQVYTNEWRGWDDFLGTGNISTENSEQTIFEARAAFLRQKISTYIIPEEEKQASNNPKNFSNSLDEDYKDEQTDPDNFLESETTWMNFNESKTFVQQLGITNLKDFFEERKNNSDIFPENFPPNPKAFYTNTGEWIDWNDFLGLTNKSYNKSNNSGENFQIEGGKLGQEDIFTDVEEGIGWEEDVEF